MTQKNDFFDVDNNCLLLPYSLQHLDFLQKASAALDILLLFIGLNSFFFDHPTIISGMEMALASFLVQRFALGCLIFSSEF